MSKLSLIIGAGAIATIAIIAIGIKKAREIEYELNDEDDCFKDSYKDFEEHTKKKVEKTAAKLRNGIDIAEERVDSFFDELDKMHEQCSCCQEVKENTDSEPPISEETTNNTKKEVKIEGIGTDSTPEKNLDPEPFGPPKPESTNNNESENNPLDF